jgi:CBS domain-containing protein
MRAHGVEAVVLVEAGRLHGVVTSADLIAWLADGTGEPGQPVGSLVSVPSVAVSPTASVADGVLTMGAAHAAALAITADGRANCELQALVTAADFSAAFGDQPIAIVRGIRSASGTPELPRPSLHSRSSGSNAAQPAR